jgi:hypothetical protein
LAASEKQVEALRQQLNTSQQQQPDETLTAKENLITELKQKVERAEQEAKDLAAKLTTQSAQAPPDSEQQKKRSPLVLMVAGLVLASAGAIGGFKAGAHSPDNSQIQVQLDAELKKEEALVNERAAQDRLLQDLRRQFDAAKQKEEQLAAELKAKVQASQKLSGSVETLQQDLAAARANVETKTRLEQQLGQNLKQATQQLLAATTKVTALQQLVQKHPSWNYTGPTEGFITWEGDVRNDKAISVTLDHGRVRVDGGARSSRLSGALPGVTCMVQPVSKNVFIATPPSVTNGWMTIVMRVEGKGPVSVKWTVL